MMKPALKDAKKTVFFNWPLEAGSKQFITHLNRNKAKLNIFSLLQKTLLVFIANTHYSWKLNEKGFFCFLICLFKFLRLKVQHNSWRGCCLWQQPPAVLQVLRSHWLHWLITGDVTVASNFVYFNAYLCANTLFVSTDSQLNFLNFKSHKSADWIE